MYCLMHKNVPVASINIKNDRPFSFIDIFNKEELPLGVYAASPMLQQNLISSWYNSRAIPNGRPSIDKIMNKLNLSQSETFLKTAGISLTDTYWIKEDTNPLTWEEVNFYDNGFEPILAKEYLTGEIKFSPSPDFTTDGLLQKFWIESYGIPYLIKIDSMHNGLQVANEVIASKIAEKLNIPCVKYTHIKIGNIHASICPSFISDSDKDFTTFLQLKHSLIGQNISVIEKIPEDFLINIITLDILIGNEDRHEKNLGFIDGKPSPLFDNGSCLNYGNIGNDIELKLPRIKRSLAAQKYQIDIEIPDFSEIIKETYDEFEISDDKTQIAVNSLKYGTDLLNRELELELD